MTTAAATHATNPLFSYLNSIGSVFVKDKIAPQGDKKGRGAAEIGFLQNPLPGRVVENWPGNLSILTGDLTRLIVIDFDCEFHAAGNITTAAITRTDAPERGKLIYQIEGNEVIPNYAPIEIGDHAIEFLGNGKKATVIGKHWKTGAPLIWNQIEIESIPLFGLQTIYDYLLGKYPQPKKIKYETPVEAFKATTFKQDDPLLDKIKASFDMLAFCKGNLSITDIESIRDGIGNGFKLGGNGGLYVYPQKGFFSSFKHNRHGDCFALVQMIYNCGFAKAKEIAAEFAGIELEKKPTAVHKPAPIAAPPTNRIAEAIEKIDDAEIADYLKNLDNQSAPPLPYDLPKYSLESVCPWLATYISHSRKVNPDSFKTYHLACGLWVLSTIAARRVLFRYAGLHHTGLYFSLAGESSIFNKTGALKYAEKLIEEGGFKFLLAPDGTTPQGLDQIMANLGIKYDTFEDMDDDLRILWTQKAKFSAKLGWIYDEFGGLLKSMANPSSISAGFSELLRKLFEFKEDAIRHTKGGGYMYIKGHYLAFLTALPPSELRRIAGKLSDLWTNGIFARFLLACPSPENKGTATPPIEEIDIPLALLAPLRDWHNFLGEPEVQISPANDGSLKIVKSNDAPMTMFFDDDVRAEAHRYYSALKLTLLPSIPEALQANYTRFPNIALRIACLLASMRREAVTVPILHAAIGIVEVFRAELHNFYNSVSKAAPSERTQERIGIEDKILKVLLKAKDDGVAMRIFSQNIACTSEELVSTIDSMAKIGKIVVMDSGKTYKGKSVYYYYHSDFAPKQGQL